MFVVVVFVVAVVVGVAVVVVVVVVAVVVVAGVVVVVEVVVVVVVVVLRYISCIRPRPQGAILRLQVGSACSLLSVSPTHLSTTSRSVKKVNLSWTGIQCCRYFTQKSRKPGLQKKQEKILLKKLAFHF